ncbi:hypothetical protein F5Y19DRAFT_356188 [Xylariaceae sp. FL1651]|nr:hypothetical protein F5Y19DRAFT_356188 [Xylariaceae sp. FL1651]
MEPVVAQCRECDHHLGRLMNVWIQIGKGYISPVIHPQDDFDIILEGDIRRGDKQTLVHDCRIQDIACNRCGSILGSKCISSAVNHVLHEGQLLIRNSSIQIKDASRNVAVELFVQRTLKLKDPPVSRVDNLEGRSYGPRFSEDDDDSPTTSDDIDINYLLADLDAQKKEIKRLDTAGYQIVASFNQAVQRIDGDVRKLKNEITQMTGQYSANHTKARGLENDISSLKVEIKVIKQSSQELASRIHCKQEMSSIKTTIAEASESLRLEFTKAWGEHQQKYSMLQTNLDNARREIKICQAQLEGTRSTARESSSVSKANTKDITALKTELQHLREELALERSCKSSSTNPAFPSRELDILTSNITKIGQRASQVEALQMEFELFKGRIQRIETQTPSAQKDIVVDLHHQEPLHSRPTSLNHRSSPDRGLKDGVTFDIPSTISSGARDDHLSWSSSPTVHRPILSLPPSAKAFKMKAKTNVPRLTKTGAVDRRTLRKRAPKAVTTGRTANG